MNDDASQPSAFTGRRQRPDRPQRTRLLLVLFVAGIAGVIAGWLSHASGTNLPAAVLTGGGAFAGAVGLLLAIARHGEAG
ncbi:hypothetical protein [Actinoplanes xinjiangensis]|jgi:hypothetical protein|uniref:Uncharacterized protein n=1 Tax=Actinoplanes xinjiangensis TaxID=512350 RepID=A0A316FGP1_9ACTN|nr:hypothetical protein [Actinoplanes xinjiangensis]PWK48078.1 hypothetical protein BC793_106105 [Actinoplanes xinjiangensis]GIF39171.1 hypothetical protein Axi01nite_34820 [Actinoplanes xinjiangensis]